MQNFKERYTYFTETLSVAMGAKIYKCAYKKIEILDAGLEDFVLEQSHSTTHFSTVESGICKWNAPPIWDAAGTHRWVPSVRVYVTCRTTFLFWLDT